MKVSGFTIVKNIIKYDYPVLEAIRSVLPICDEFIVNIGVSQDETFDLIKSLKDPKIKIVQTNWDHSRGPEVLSFQTNVALSHCTGDWAFYIQADEVVHEDDLPRLKQHMEMYLHDKSVDALRFKYFHFYGSYWRYRIDKGWYQKQDRIIRNYGGIESYGDAFAFRRKDGQPLKTVSTGCFIYHYGWVHSGEIMSDRLSNYKDMGFEGLGLKNFEKGQTHKYGDLNRFPVYFGKHPHVMSARVGDHLLSSEDRRDINKRFWWYPPNFLRMRYKSFRRVKETIV